LPGLYSNARPAKHQDLADMIYLMSAINRRMAIDTTERQQLIKLQNYLQSAVHSAFLVPSNGT